MKYVKNFAPSWFASVMGTGIVAISCKMYSDILPFLSQVAYLLFLFNLFLCSIFLIFWISRWIFYPQKAIEDLFHPILSSFYPTIAVAFLVISGGFIIIENDMKIAEIIWTIGVVLTIFFSFMVPFIMFTHEKIAISHINPGWYIPPVGLIVIPVAGSFFEPLSNGYYKDLIIIVNSFGFGAGLFLYLALLSIIIYRFILHSPLPGKLSPTIWINLGPIGAGNIALVNIVSKSSFIETKEPFFIFSLFFWGFGLWWLIMAILITIRYIKKAQLNYSLSWWAFIFPLGAYTASTHIISKVLHVNAINMLGFIMFLLLFFMWSATVIGTAKNIKNIFEG